MNNLHRDIEKGEIVVLNKDLFKPQYHELRFRLFEVESGFGMSSFTAGGAIYGKSVCDGEEFRIDGSDIDAKETIQYQKEQAEKRENA
jgi:hypothetical protein